MTQYLSLAEYFWLAEQVTGTAAELLVKVSRSDLADSALHARRPASATRTSTPTSSARPPSSPAGWRGTTRSPTAISAPLGRPRDVHRPQRRPLASGSSHRRRSRSSDCSRSLLMRSKRTGSANGFVRDWSSTSPTDEPARLQALPLRGWLSVALARRFAGGPQHGADRSPRVALGASR